MQISTKFSIAIHILTATAYFSQDYKVTSDFLAGSVGCNPVIIRNLVGQLKGAGLLETRRGPGGITLAKPLGEITSMTQWKRLVMKSCSVSIVIPIHSAL